MAFIFNCKGSIDYFKEQQQLHKLNKDLQSETEFLSKNSIESWYESYIEWANKTVPQYVNTASKYH